VLQGIIDSHSTQNMELQLVQRGAAAGGSLSELMLKNSVLIGNDAGDDDSAVELAARLGRARWGEYVVGLELVCGCVLCLHVAAAHARSGCDGDSRSLVSGGKAP
jgi:hypothetical protein